MKFLIKNYNKDADNNKEMLATVLCQLLGNKLPSL